MGLTPQECQDRLRQAAAQYDLQAYLDLPPKSLNRGLRTKTAIAAIVAMQPQVLIVDEPTSGLDRREALEILESFQSLAASGGTVIFITHEMDLVAQFAQRAVVMHNGNFLCDGPPARVFADQAILQQASLSPPDFIRLAMGLGWTEFTGLRTAADLADRIASRM
jgi:energy-coupling factor transport system ATP-binding protein